MNRQQRRQAARQGTTLPPSPNAESGQPPQQVKAIATLTIHLLPGGQVAINVPRNPEHLFMMLSGFFTACSTKFTLKEESKIIAPPPGFRP